MGGKVLVPTRDAVQKLVAARLAADVLDVPTVLSRAPMRTPPSCITSDCDPEDSSFLTGERTVEGFFSCAAALTRLSPAAWPMRPMQT